MGVSVTAHRVQATQGDAAPSATTLTRVSRVSRERGEVLCDHCGRTAPRDTMALDPDPESESGYVCAEGHGCAAPRVERVTVAGRRLPADALQLPDAAAKVRAQVEADLIAAGCGVTRGLPRPVREALLLELRARCERESLRLVEVSKGQSGHRIAAQLEVALRAGRALSRYLIAAKGPRRSS